MKMPSSDYMVQEHIAELQRVAAQMRLAREALACKESCQPKTITRWRNRLVTAITQQTRRSQPEFMVVRGKCLPELRIDDAVC